jgi:hypothetical protein
LHQKIENLKLISTAFSTPNETSGGSDATQNVNVADHDRQNESANTFPASRRVAASDISIEVHRTINEAARRKSNVVITGLPEPTNSTEEENK